MKLRSPIGRRGLALGLALLLAVLSGVALTSYIRGVEDRAAAENEQVEVLYAKDTIPEGTSATEAAQRGLVGTQAVPQRAVATGAISTLDPLGDGVASVDIYPGEQLVATRFVEPDARDGLLTIPEGKRAMTIDVAVPPGVAGFIRPGARTSILAQLTAPAVDPEGADAGTGEGEARVAYLLQDVTVLAVGRRTVTVEGQETVVEPEERVMLTLAVSAQEAEKLAYGVLNGQLYLTLLPHDVADEDAVVDTPGRTARNAFDEAPR